MVFIIILRDYFRWHYSRAFSDIFAIWRSITYFVFHFFSIPALFRTLFNPWKRIEAERETQGFDLGDYLSTKIVNFIMRIIGAVMRLTLIVIGFIIVGIVVIVGLQFFVLWTILPPLVVLVFVAGIHLLIFM